MALTRPGELLTRLDAECGLHGGKLTRIPTRLALSQLCICGHRSKKPLSQRIHQCDHCGFGPVDRDLMSAFLAHLVGRLGEQIFCTAVTEGTLATAGGVDEAKLNELLTRPVRVPSPSAPSKRRKRCETAVDGLALAKVACSGSNVSDQTDGTTAVGASPPLQHGSGQRSTKEKTPVRRVSLTTFETPTSVSDIGPK
jgi:hypothetical protein